jgi:RHS repeat-associated protein
MLLNKSDVGVYTYGASGAGAVRPHALLSMTGGGGVTTTYTYDANGNLVTASGGKYRSIAYTSFNLPDSQSGIGGELSRLTQTSPRYTWLYDENRQRIKEVRTMMTMRGTTAGTRTTWYLHPDNAGGLGFEQEVNAPLSPSAANPAVTSNRHYLSFGGGAIGVLVSTGALTTPATATAPPVISSIAAVKVEYWHKDHLGSLIASTDHAGVVTARYAYDPFGKRRFTNGSYDAFGSIVVDWSAAVRSGTDRGYTGHEHLDDVGIVHMNGRLFDPTLGRFLQTDPFVQDPKNLQNYNRYAYCLNNPLTCTDPTGFETTTIEITGQRFDLLDGFSPFRDPFFIAQFSTFSSSDQLIIGLGRTPEEKYRFGLNIAILNNIKNSELPSEVKAAWANFSNAMTRAGRRIWDLPTQILEIFAGMEWKFVDGPSPDSPGSPAVAFKRFSGDRIISVTTFYDNSKNLTQKSLDWLMAHEMAHHILRGGFDSLTPKKGILPGEAMADSFASALLGYFPVELQGYFFQATQYALDTGDRSLINQYYSMWTYGSSAPKIADDIPVLGALDFPFLAATDRRIIRPPRCASNRTACM